MREVVFNIKKSHLPNSIEIHFPTIFLCIKVNQLKTWIQKSFIIPALYPFGVSRVVCWRPSALIVRHRPHGCFLSECSTGGRPMAAPCGYLVLALIHQRRARNLTGRKDLLSSVRYDSAGIRAQPNNFGDTRSLPLCWNEMCIHTKHFFQSRICNKITSFLTSAAFNFAVAPPLSAVTWFLLN